MIKSTIEFKHFYDLSEVEMMKMILSSGDYFPGFYRFTLGTQKVGDESLSLNTLVLLFLEQLTTGNLHSKEDWLDLQHEIHDRDVASEKARNAGNFPEVRQKFTDKMMQWYFDCSGFDIIYMDTETKVREIEVDKTYYFMGSLVRFLEDRFEVGFDRLQETANLTLNVDFKTVKNYIKDTFTTNQIKDLFLYADIIARLEFNDKDEAKLNMNESLLDQFMVMPTSIKVFGSPIESSSLPMRYAKPIRLTNFTRGEDGKFKTWQSDQNW